MSQMNPKEVFPTLHTQFNYLTQPVTPFKHFFFMILMREKVILKGNLQKRQALCALSMGSWFKTKKFIKTQGYKPPINLTKHYMSES